MFKIQWVEEALGSQSAYCRHLGGRHLHPAIANMMLSNASTILWIFCAFRIVFGQQQNGTAPLIKVGLLMPHNQSSDLAFARSAGAIPIAVKHILNDNLLPAGTNFSFVVRFEDCVMSMAAGYAFDLMVDQQVDLFIAPPCADSAQVALFVSTFYNIPAITWGQNSDSAFSSQSNYPTMMSALPNYADFGQIVISLCNFFNWTVMALIYQLSETGQCASFQQDMQIAINSNDKCVISYREEIKVKISAAGTNDVQYTISQIQSRARIIILCFDDFVQQRNFVAKLQQGGLDSADYVYLIPGLTMDNGIESVSKCLDMLINFFFFLDGSKATAWWVDSNPTIQAAAYKIAQRSFYLMVDIYGKGQVENGSTFDQEVIKQVAQWPFYCTDCDQSLQVSSYAPLLYDSFYLYAVALAKAINSTGSSASSVYRNGLLLRSQLGNLSFNGLTGENKFGADGLRNCIYLIAMYSSINGDLTSYLWLQMNDAGVVNSTWVNASSEQQIWSSRNGAKPLAVPLCGFDGNGCRMDFFTEYRGYVIAAGFLMLIILGSIIFGIYWLFQSKAQEMERQNRLWQIAYNSLTPAGTKKKMMESVRSLQSSSSSQFTRDSSHSHISIKHTFNGVVFILSGERVIGVQHSVGVRLSQQDMAELRTMRLLDADNVNRFVGLSIDGAALLSLWRYCSRGPLSDVITGSSSLTMDGFFIYSLARDVAEGLRFIHASPIGWHGNLRSTNCLIDDRWQVKLSEFGLRFFRAHEKRETKELVWTAPELLRESDLIGSKPGDVYSFAIVSSEPIWDQDDAKANVEEFVYMIRTGGRKAFRPKLEPSSQDLSPALLHLIKDCWDESPAERPKMETVNALLQSMNTGRSTNLMDHVFNMLEVYAGSLEEEVEERTKELVEEKKKTDILLYRMLPKQVADKLKLGQSVEPESFDCVTVFFSDVVSFTTIASKCSPLQVVNLLNNLYTLLDSIIGEFDVYKVETIGDGYLCVSGLPHRNGHEHARHIANMSLAFMRSLGSFTIPHLPTERLRLRIGIHTGSTVAGVVGLSMPRYCLFGDTINTAARLESSSKPMRIHISTTTNHFLVNALGGFVTQARGEILVKGKGVLETFWLLGVEGDPAVTRLQSSDGINATIE
uniref:Guanylate cyclase n=1 Tax=Globodera rostochiensis TaxID=31243 RepID=A0A914HN36_GLORO